MAVNKLQQGKRILRIWLAGKFKLLNKVCAIIEYNKWYFAYYGKYPRTMKDATDFLETRYNQVKKYSHARK